MIFGRDVLVETLARNEAPVVILTGDAGIGKSAVLGELARLPLAGWIAADREVLRRSPGSLHAAFLDGLGSALGLAVEQGLDETTLGQRLAEAARRLANEKDSVLARVVFAELVSIVRARAKLGSNFGTATADFARELWPDSAERLLSKVSQARDQLSAEILSGYATASAEILDDYHVALHLDQAENLSDDDLRGLCDLADLLPSRFHLRVAFATDRGDRRDTVTDLAASSSNIRVIEVSPLDGPVISDWLEAEGLDKGLAAEVMRETGGYPLRVEAVIADVQGGGTVAEAPRDAAFAARTRASWDRLSPRAASAARALAVLRDPVSEDQLREVAGASSVVEWAGIVEELKRARMFSVEINGVPWFHSERQAFILRECLTEAQRDAAANAAAETLVRVAPADPATAGQQMSSVLHLARQSSSFRTGHPEIAAVVGLSDAALAVAAALVELRVEGRPAIADSDALLGHALTLIDRIEQPVAAVTELDERRLVAVESDNAQTLVMASWEPEIEAAIAAEGAERLRRPPIPRIAEALFESTLKPDLGQFVVAQYGIGNPSFAGLGAVAAHLASRSRFINRRNLGFNLLSRGSMEDGVSLYAAVHYEDEAGRDAALGRVRGRTFPTPFGDISFEDVIAHPQRAIPSQRFGYALGRVSGIRPRNVYQPGLPRTPAPGGEDYQTLAERRLETAAFMRSQSDELERVALRLDRGYLLAWDAGDEFWIECIVCSDHDEHRHVPALHGVSVRSHYGNLEVRQACNLGNRDDFIHERGSYGSNSKDEPASAEISFRIDQAGEFNRTQPRLEVPLSQPELQELIEAAFHRELEDARQMSERLPFAAHKAVNNPVALWLLVTLGDKNGVALFGPHHASARYAFGPSPSGTDQARVRVIPASEFDASGEWGSTEAFFGSAFPEATELGDQVSVATADAAIARLLGYTPNDIELVWPEVASPNP